MKLDKPAGGGGARFTAPQTKTLEAEFAKDSKPSAADYERIAAAIRDEVRIL